MDATAINPQAVPAGHYAVTLMDSEGRRATVVARTAPDAMLPEIALLILQDLAHQLQERDNPRPSAVEPAEECHRRGWRLAWSCFRSYRRDHQVPFWRAVRGAILWGL